MVAAHVHYGLLGHTGPKRGNVCCRCSHAAAAALAAGCEGVRDTGCAITLSSAHRCQRLGSMHRCSSSSAARAPAASSISRVLTGAGGRAARTAAAVARQQQRLPRGRRLSRAPTSGDAGCALTPRSAQRWPSGGTSADVAVMLQ
ncbi:hypothetical protein CVIRNUC_008621 [Coccomyxa viridis]|uniref:Uncharacterized protein n=1 Tax=Coccomyxa viridis TaxID=1274662 RepID=A0AAV1IGT3_9CHLO|nr:hypothetical protein CVIRNUC_008621 [Coccomyxa viridis]